MESLPVCFTTAASNTSNVVKRAKSSYSFLASSRSSSATSLSLRVDHFFSVASTSLDRHSANWSAHASTNLVSAPPGTDTPHTRSITTYWCAAAVPN